jgi:LacI family transcriptional regulator
MSLVTLKEIAESVGISESTASRALRNHPDVSEETRNKVMQVAEDMGYFPSFQARGLASGSSNIVGLLVADLSNFFYPNLAWRIEHAAQAEGYSVMLFQTGDDPDQSERAIQRLLSYRVAGIIHASVHLDEPSLEIAHKAGFPLVVTNRRPEGNTSYDQVVPNYFEGARKATHHLLASGRRKIYHLGGPRYASSSMDVADGFRHAIEEAGLAYRQSMISEGTFEARSGRERAEEIFAKGTIPEAILAVNDYTALGAMEVFLRAGIRIPEDVAIIGFDNIEIASFPTIQLSSVDLECDKVATETWQLLLERMTAEEVKPPQKIVSETNLIVRRSSEVA